MKTRHVVYLGEWLMLLMSFSSFGWAQGIQIEHVMNIGSQGNGAGQFMYVEDFAFDQKGALLATDAANSNIQAFDKTTGAFIAQFGGKGDRDEKFEKPEGIAVAPNGDIFVADYATGYIKKFDAQYQWLLTFSDYGDAPGQNMRSEFMDIFDEKLYMAEVGSNRVDVFDLNGNFLFLFGKTGTLPGELQNPEAAKVNSKGEVYVTDLKNDRIQIFSSDGQFLRTFGVSGSGQGEFKAPAGLAIDKQDRIYITEIGNDRIQVFDKDDKFLTMWGQPGTGDGEFENLHGIIVDDETGRIYVADTGNNRIQVFQIKE